MTSTETASNPTTAVRPTPAAPAAGPVDPLGSDIIGLLRSLKLSGMKDTLPERLSLARTRQMGHAAFLELLLSDEVSRRDARSATIRAAHAGLLPLMRLDTWNEHENLVYDRQLLSDLTSLRVTEAGHNVLILGPVGVGKTHLATALGHIAIRRRMTVQMARAEKPVHPATRRPARPHPGRGIPPADPPRPAHHRRLRPPARWMPPRPRTSTNWSWRGTRKRPRSGPVTANRLTGCP